jgi:lipase
MPLHSRKWGAAGATPVVCVHGVTQHGGIFESLGRRLAEDGHRVIAVDLRGHGNSERRPPWNIETHIADLIETLEEHGLERATFVGHSLGGRLAAELAAAAPERVERLVLLDPALSVSPDHALKSAEMDRLDWSFSSVDGAVNALVNSDMVVSAPRETVTAYAMADLQAGSDGRLRFSFCPSAVVGAWSEMPLPPPEIVQVPTLLVCPLSSPVHDRAQDQRYRAALGSLLTMAAVPNGHNVLWESPAETAAAIASFLAKTSGATASS